MKAFEMTSFVDRFFLKNFSEKDTESRFQARVLITSHFVVSLLLGLVLFLDYVAPMMEQLIVGILALSLLSIIFIRLGHLTLTTLLTYTGIGILATLIVFTSPAHVNYETYMLATFHMFIILIASLLTRQRFYTIFTTGLGIFSLALLLFFRSMKLATPISLLEIDDYLICMTLLAMAGLILLRTAERRKQLLEIAERETERSEIKSAQLAASLKEKEILLNEVHHRVKNNLNVAISLLRMQIDRTSPSPETVEALQVSIHRLHSMAIVHERLYTGGNFSAIEFRPYIMSILDSILQSYKHAGVAFELDVSEELSIGIDRAVPCGLILNELITNVFKHAYPGEKSGKARVEFKPHNGEFNLVVSDEGVGVSEKDWRESQSLGTRVITLLTEQLGGSLTVNGTKGTRIMIRFPLEPI